MISEGGETGKRARLLPAYVEIMAAIDDLKAAEQACAELDSIAEAEEQPGALTATAAQARGLVELAAGRSQAALASLRRADELWRRLAAPYESARARELIGLACRSARGRGQRAVSSWRPPATPSLRLGAATDLARLEGRPAGRAPATHTSSPSASSRSCACSAPGETNKEIAAALVVSVRTVDRHVSNIYAKLGVSSRAAATSYAHEHGLVRPATG